MTDYAFPASKFTLPGDPGKVWETAGAYGRFATAAGEGAGGLRGLQVSSWLGTEGDIYRGGVAQLPPQLDTAHGSYSQVASALNGFAEVLDREQRAIGVIRTYAQSDWQALRDARSQRTGLRKPTDGDLKNDPNAQATYDSRKGGLDRRIAYLEGQWRLRLDAASSVRGRVDEAARAAGHQIRAAGRASPTADQNWFEDKWEKTKRAVGDAIDGLKHFLADHAGFFRGLAKVLRVAGYLLMVVGALTTVFFGVGGALMLIGGGLVAAGDILDKSVDWAEGKISGWDLLKSAGISILVNVGLGAAGRLALPLAARFAGPLLAKAGPLVSKVAPFMNKMADLGNKLKITPALGKFDNLVDGAVNKVVPGWLRVAGAGGRPSGGGVPPQVGEPARNPFDGARDFDSRQAADDWGTSAYGDTAAALPPDVREAVLDYTGSSNALVNSSLRSPDGISRPAVDDLITNLDHATNAQAIPENIVVYRNSGPGMIGNDGLNSVGNVYDDPGFMSTSLHQTPYPDNPVHMKLNVPEGSRALYLGDDLSSSPGESEILFSRGQRYRVISATQRPDGGYDVEAELLPPEG